MGRSRSKWALAQQLPPDGIAGPGRRISVVGDRNDRRQGAMSQGGVDDSTWGQDDLQFVPAGVAALGGMVLCCGQAGPEGSLPLQEDLVLLELEMERLLVDGHEKIVGVAPESRIVDALEPVRLAKEVCDARARPVVPIDLDVQAVTGLTLCFPWHGA